MKQLKVLLVDDEADFANTLAERLLLRGISAEVATDGETALKMVEQNHPHVIVLDLKMPGLGGLEVLERIMSRDKSIRVILLTGHGSTREGIEGMRLGAYDYLMKPIDINELIDRLRDAAS
jgi:DNA-binding response OmpR family regulator